MKHFVCAVKVVVLGLTASTCNPCIDSALKMFCCFYFDTIRIWKVMHIQYVPPNKTNKVAHSPGEVSGHLVLPPCLITVVALHSGQLKTHISSDRQQRLRSSLTNAAVTSDSIEKIAKLVS